jgi:signal transduction histidine kinase
MSEIRPRPVIWIVDDSPTEAAFTRKSLGPAFEIECMHDATAAVERLTSSVTQPDLLILDWVMPGMTGDEICRFLRTHDRTKELPIIIVTASRIETADLVEGLASGANDYVPRPFAIEELRARVNAALRTKELADASVRERNRLAAVNRLAQELLTVTSISSVLDTLATVLVGSMCDGCGVLLLPGQTQHAFVARHRHDPSGRVLGALATVADPRVVAFSSSEHAAKELPAYADYIARFGLAGLAILPLPPSSPVQGLITLTRDLLSEPFDKKDIATLEACLEFCALAMQNAVRLDAERTVAAERERIARFQEEMVAIVGHDLRNPLSALLAGMDLLPAQGESAPIVDRMRSSTNRMVRIVEQLLDITHARLGHGIPVQRRKVALAPIVKGVVDEVLLKHPETRFELIGTDVEGCWDADRLAQVLANLVANALHYGKRDGLITIAVDRDDTLTRISVKNPNRAAPIPADQRERLFEPFERGTTPGAGGLGLGLYIVREVARAHGGRADVESTEAGTVFRVSLPNA